jgi:hypothetical protein
MTLFSTFVFTVYCRKTQFQLSFFRHHSVEIVSIYVSKSTPLFGSVSLSKWGVDFGNFFDTFLTLLFFISFRHHFDILLDALVFDIFSDIISTFFWMLWFLTFFPTLFRHSF